MTLIDTVHSGGVGRMHGGTKIARPLLRSQGPDEAMLLHAPGMLVGEKEGTSGLNRSSRPGWVIRRRIMVCQSEEADEDVAGPCAGLTPALLNQPSAGTTSCGNHSHRKMVDQSLKQCDVRSSSTTTSATTATQDQCPPMTKLPKKTLRLFDLNKLPNVQENVWSPGSSPTSTIESADSTSHHDASNTAMATKATDVFFSGITPPNCIKRIRDEGRALAVDLGLLHSLEEAEGLVTPPFAFRKPQPWEADCADVPTPARKRLRKLSECAGGTTSMAKSWTTRDGDGGTHHRDDVPKTVVASNMCRPDAVVDDEVLGAVAALLLMSSSSRRRNFLFSSNGDASSSGRSGFSDTSKDDEEMGEAGNSKSRRSRDLAASDSEDPSRSLGSGSSVLLRPKNKRRYRSMAEIMVQTRCLNRRRT